MSGPLSTSAPPSVGPALLCATSAPRSSPEIISGAADWHGHAARHTTLARTAESRKLQSLHRLFQIRIGHDDQVVFRAARGLNSLAVGGARLIDVPGNCRRADERYGSH